jgi:hypothetical protein
VTVVVAGSAARAGKLSNDFLNGTQAICKDVEGGCVLMVEEGLVDGHQLRPVDRVILRETRCINPGELACGRMEDGRP